MLFLLRADTLIEFGVQSRRCHDKRVGNDFVLSVVRVGGDFEVRVRTAESGAGAWAEEGEEDGEEEEAGKKRNGFNNNVLYFDC